MPIRKRITDLHGQEYKDFQKRLREGPPPKAPRKPKAEERAPVLEAFKRIPYDKRMSVHEWSQRYQAMFLSQVFHLWGVELALYPASTSLGINDDVRCIGVFVLQRTRTRRGIQPKITLRGNPRYWYGQLIDWIDDNNYSL